MWQFLVPSVVPIAQGWHLALPVDVVGFRPRQVQVQILAVLPGVVTGTNWLIDLLIFRLFINEGTTVENSALCKVR